MIRPRLILSFALLALGGCQSAPTDAPIAVSVIGQSSGLADPSSGRIALPQRLLLDATAQGLVRLDATGQVEPGLADRWIMIDDGKSWIFRLGQQQWPDGEPVTAGDVVAVLNRARAEGARNPMQTYLANVDEVVAMTPEIVEIRLRRPVPALLGVLASPELAIVRQRGLGGSGPMRVTGHEHGALTLRPVLDPGRVQDGDGAASGDTDPQVQFRVERASRAIARFKLHQADLVTGGTFADWPLLAVAGIVANQAQIDPANGLFGLAVVSRTGFLSEAGNRAALAMAIDRDALTGTLRSDWPASESVMPARFDMAADPAQPDWAALSPDQRRSAARAQVSAWRARHPGPVVVRIALPPGPGAVRLWNRLFQDFAAIGVVARPAKEDETADLRLIDRVAPFDSARWYLTMACRLCSPDAIALIDAARDAPNVDARAHRLAEADAMLAKETAFIPLARPLRWSLVMPRLDLWQRNARAWHPLDSLHNRDD